MGLIRREDLGFQEEKQTFSREQPKGGRTIGPWNLRP